MILDYEQKYKEALERARDMMSYKEVRREDMEYLFPELGESEDERIRKAILEHIQLCSESIPDRDKWIAWLEKQCNKGSQVILSPFTFDDILALQCCMETVKKVQEDKDLYEKLKDLHGRVYDAYQLEKQEKPQQEPTSDHWQEVRDRAAIAAMQGYMSCKCQLVGAINLAMAEGIADQAIMIADTLVKKLKGE